MYKGRNLLDPKDFESTISLKNERFCLLYIKAYSFKEFLAYKHSFQLNSQQIK